jgi:hypothetical protein
MEFKLDNTIINTLNMEFKGFQVVMKSLITLHNTGCVDWVCFTQDMRKSHHTQFLFEFGVYHNVTMKILI